MNNLIISVEEKDRITKMIIELEIAALEKWNQGDPSGYLELYTNDFTYFDPMIPKRSDGFKSIQTMYKNLRGEVKIDSYKMIDPVVQIKRDTGVLTYNLESLCGDKCWKWNCTEVYQLQEDGKWKIIHNHWSIIQPFGDTPPEDI